MQQTVDSQGRPLSGWWRRAAAFILDSLILVVVVVVFTVGFGSAIYNSDLSGFALTLAAALFASIVVLLYCIYLPVRWNGQTVGKKALSIRIVRLDGDPINAKTMWLRYGLMQYLPNFASNLLSPLLVLVIPYYLADYLWPLWDKQRQCLHDKVAKTQVIFEGEPATASAAAPGWYDNPHNSSQLRYFNGQSWTDQVTEKQPPWLPPTGVPQGGLPENPERPEGQE